MKPEIFAVRLKTSENLGFHAFCFVAAFHHQRPQVDGNYKQPHHQREFLAIPTPDVSTLRRIGESKAPTRRTSTPICVVCLNSVVEHNGAAATNTCGSVSISSRPDLAAGVSGAAAAIP